MRRRRAAALVLAAAAAASSAAPAVDEAGFPASGPPRLASPSDSYEQQFDVRFWGGLGQIDLYGARLAIRDENWTLQNDFWKGTIDEGDLRRSVTGGLEVSYGTLRDVKFLAALEGTGSSAVGTFEGEGPKTVLDPMQGLLHQRLDRVSRYTAFGQMVGATVLMRGFDWCRFGLTLRGGVFELAGAVERGTESGPIRDYWWSRKLSGTAPAVQLGLEWEWLAVPGGGPLPLAGFVSAGYRVLQFRRVSFSYLDSTGAAVHGGYNNPDGTRRVFDLSGVEVRLGLQISSSFAPTP